MPVPGAPTLVRPTQSGQSAPSSTATVPVIPFTRAARKKNRLIGTYGPFTLSANAQQLAPIQVPANGYLRRIWLDVTVTAAGNAAAVALANDAPFNLFSQIQFAAANGDTIISTVDGFTLYCVNKYGAHALNSYDPVRDPNYSVVTGTGATGGSMSFRLYVPCELDARDATGALANMAANQAFNLNLWLNTLANIFTTAPTAAPTVTIQVSADYWAAPAAQNPQGVAQATAPLCNGLVSLIQTETPPIVANTDQTLQLHNVGNTVRYLMFILRNGSGVRTETDWPSTLQFAVNNDVWRFFTKNLWRNYMANAYGYFNGISANPQAGKLDNGVFVVMDFMDDGADGNGRVTPGQNRDLMLVTGSATALNIEAQNWGAGAGSLLVVTNALRVPDPTAFYHPFGM